MNPTQKRDPARMVGQTTPDKQIFERLKRRFVGSMKAGKFHKALVDEGLVVQARNSGGHIVLTSPTGMTAHIPGPHASMSPVAMQNIAKQLLRPSS